MRAFVFLLIISIFCVPCRLNAQSTLNFSRVMGLSDLPLTGYAVVNPGSTSATINFTLYGSDGSVVGLSTQTIVAGGQISKLASELFPAVKSGGWTQATSSSSGLRGFWLSSDFVTYGDSAAAADAAAGLIFPLVTTSSEIDLVNPNSTSGAFLIQLYGAEGQTVAEPAIEIIPARGSYRQPASSIFAPDDVNIATIAKITCQVACAGSILVRDFLAAPSLAVANGISTASTTLELNFPQVVQGVLGTQNYTTLLSVTNLTAAAQTLTITYTPGTGGQPTSVQRDVAANGTLREGPDTLFGFSSGFQTGWIRVVSVKPVAGIVIYAELVAAGVTITPAQSQTTSNLILGHIADLPPWWTGLALLNPGTTDALVDVFAIAPDGTLIGRSPQIDIPSGAKISKLLSEWIPQTQTRSQDGGFVFVRSTIPLYGMELFFTRDLQILSNVPAFGLGSTEQFTPPPPSNR